MAQFIMRVDKREKIKDEFINKYITFSCPANWHDLANKNGNDEIGDLFECIYAHLENGDTRIFNESDCFGKPMGNNLVRIISAMDKSVYLRNEPVLLTPAYCFFQFNITKEQLVKDKGITFNIAEYCKDIKYDINDVYFFIVNDAGKFESDLKINVPIAVEKSDKLITDGSEGYVKPFDKNNPINYSDIDYNKHDVVNDFYYEKNNYRNEMWWKNNKYKYQHEGRVVIPSVQFIQRYSDNPIYDYSKNILKVNLPNLHEYADICDGSSIGYIEFTLDSNEEIKMKYVKAKLD